MSVPDWKLERMLQGEVPPEESEKERLDALRREDEEILAAHPPAEVAREVRRRGAQAEWQRPRIVRYAMPVLAAAAAVLLFVAIPQEPTERSKGATPYLVIHRSAGDSADRLEPGARVNARDVLQVSYVALGRPYGLILSIDGAGVVTLHHPALKDGDQKLVDQDGAVPLPSAYELDDAPDFERFLFVTSNQPLDVDAILEKARHDDLRGLEVSSFLLSKGAAP